MSDNNLGDSQEFKVSVLERNAVPILEPIPDQIANEDDPYRDDINLSFYDVDGNVVRVEISYEDVNKVDCVVSDGKLGFKPAFNFYGDAVCTVKITDNDGATDEKNVIIHVNPVNDPPVIDSYQPLNDQITIEEGNLEFSISWSDIDNYNSEVVRKWYVNTIEKWMGDSYIFDGSEKGVYNIKVVVDDGNKSAIKEWNLTVTGVIHAPTIDAYSPIEDIVKIAEDESLKFSVTALDLDNDILTYSWKLNGNEVSTNNNYIFNATEYVVGSYNVKVIVSDGQLTDDKEWELIVGDKPIADGFDGNTTDFSELNLDELDNIANVVLEKTGKGKIEFLESLNLEDVVDLDNTVKIKDGMVAVDTNRYPQLKDKRARITLFGSYNSIPKIYYNEGFTTNPSDINKECDFCELLSYDDFPTSNGKVIFEIPHLSSYKLGNSGIKYDLDKFDELSKCELDKQGNLDVKIKEPDNNDDFKVGETIKIEVEVENNNDEDKDVIVEAILYDIDKNDEIKKIESDDEEIDKKDDYKFELELEIPNDFDEKNNYILFVKAYEDGNEEQQCNYDIIKVNLEREKHEVVINEIKIMPEEVAVGGGFRAFIEIENIGREDEKDVYIKLENNELGINIESDKFKLDSKDKDSKSFSVKIPEDAKDGSYNLKTSVYYKGGSDSREGIFNIKEEEFVEEIIIPDQIKPVNITLKSKEAKIDEDGIGKSFIKTQTRVLNFIKKISLPRIGLPGIPSYLHGFLFGIVVLFTLVFLYKEI